MEAHNYSFCAEGDWFQYPVATLNFALMLCTVSSLKPLDKTPLAEKRTNECFVWCLPHTSNSTEEYCLLNQIFSWFVYSLKAMKPSTDLRCIEEGILDS